MHDPKSNRQKRPTEPLPKTAKPALIFLGFLFVLTVVVAVAAYIVDRQFYG